MQKAPAGTVINAWVDTRDFVLNAGGGTYAKKYYSATVGSDGFYSLVVDVSKHQPAAVHIEGQQFAYDVVVKKMISGTLKVTTERRVLSSVPVPTVSAHSGREYITDVNFTN
jgi:hypothetical protein